MSTDSSDQSASISFDEEHRQVLVEKTILSETSELATLRLHRPEALNAITPTMLQQLHQAFQVAVEDPSVAAIRITGSGRAFSAGVDLKSLSDTKVENGSVGSSLDDSARRLIRAFEVAPKVVIAQVNGFCFTGALELALGCDLIVAAKEAKLGDTHAKWGLRPTWGMSQRLPRMVGLARARELSYTARTFTGEQALAWGLAVFAPPLEDLDMVVLEIAQQIAQNSSGSIAAYKDLYRHRDRRELERGLAHESETEYSISDTRMRLQSFLE